MPPRARLAPLVALLILALLPPSASADPFGPLDSQTRLTQIGPDGNPVFDTNDPAVAYDSRRDQFLIAWSGVDPSAPNDVAIYGRVLEGRGQPIGGVQRLTSATTVNALAPQLAYASGSDKYVLVYTARVTAPTQHQEVFAQDVSASGARAGAEVRVSSGTGWLADEPALAYDAEHDQVRLVWTADVVASDFEIRSRRFTSALAAIGGTVETPISATAAGDSRSPAIADLPAEDRYLIVWEGDAAVARPEIFAESIGIDGSIVAAQAQISSAGARTTQAPDVAADPGIDQAMVSFVKDDIPGEGPEVLRAAAHLEPVAGRRRHAHQHDGAARQHLARRRPLLAHADLLQLRARPLPRHLAGRQRPARPGRRRA